MSARWFALASALAVVAVAPTAVIAGTCTVTSVAPVAFGTYDVFDSSPVLSTGAISLECSDMGPTDTVRIDLDGGGAGSIAARRLFGGAFQLAYNLFLDAARTVIWGDGTGGSSSYGPIQPANGVTTVYLYGEVPAGQDVGAGVYTDTITITVQF